MAPRVPGASYRLQLDRRFGFAEARRRQPYLTRLGIETLYLSPILAARAGSPHGYDGVDPGRIDAERGGESEFRRLARAARARGVSVLVDVVPNHLAASLENPAWRDVLARGRRSRFSRLFDIDWERSPPGRPSVALPWLDRPLEAAFASGAMAFEGGARGLGLRVGGAVLPVSLPARARFRRWVRAEAGRGGRGARAPLARVLARLNRGSDAENVRRRAQLLGDLAYRPIPWREVDAVNYRRFADVSDLVAVRPGSRAGFEYLHRRLLRAVRDGEVQGLRIDHLDGIADPVAYLRQLQRALARAQGRSSVPPAPEPFYVVAEKVLARSEKLPVDWPIAGTTGYETMSRIFGVLVPTRAAAALERAYRDVVPRRERSFAGVAYRARREVGSRLFASDRAELGRRLRAGGTGRPLRVSADRVGSTLTSLASALPVYRTYLRPGRRAARTDRAVLRSAVSLARRLDRGAPPAPEVLLALERGRPPTGISPRAWSSTVARWQQWTAELAAKGTEDTAFYRFVRFVGANEVGGDPERVACAPGEFHTFMVDRARHHPHGLTATSTHDSKWGEDVRARFVALAEFAEEWAEATRRWRRAHRRFVRAGGRGAAPSPKEEYRLYQTWVGAAPLDDPFGPPFRMRLREQVQKAAREAKEATSWLDPDPEHEAGLAAFVERLATDRRAAPFRRELLDWVRRLAFLGGYYSLAQTVLRTTVPGVPDVYQGSEGFNLSCVDPDNRRAVPFDRLDADLAAIDARSEGDAVPAPLYAPSSTGVSESLKLAVTAGLLRFRRAHRARFDRGSYLALREETRTPVEPVLAFARRSEDGWVLVAVGRGLRRVSDGARTPPVAARWSGRRLRVPPGAPDRWRDVLTGATARAVRAGRGRYFDLAELFRDLPVAVLEPLPLQPS